MKTLISICVCLILAIPSAQKLGAQPTEPHSLGTLIPKSELYDISFYHFHSDAQKRKLFLLLTGRGYVDNGSFKLILGSTPTDSITCMAVLEYAPDMTLVKEDIYALEIEGDKNKIKVTSAKKNALIAAGENCLDYDWEGQLEELHPELIYRTVDQSSNEPIPLYFKNSLRYRFSGEVDKIRLERYKLRANDHPQPKKNSLLGGLFEFKESDYEMESSEIELRPYKDGNKEEHWVRQYSSECDPLTGSIYAWHHKYIKKFKSNKSKNYFHEFVVFDAEGNLIQNTEITFDLPHEFAYRDVFTHRDANKRFSHYSFIQVYKQGYGFGFKKLNPDPDKLVRHIYHWDKSGQLFNKNSFYVPNEDTQIKIGLPTDNAITLIGWNEDNLYSIISKENELTEFLSIEDNSPLLADHRIETKELRANWMPRTNYVTAENKHLFVHDLHRKFFDFKTRDTVFVKSGLVFTAVDENGNIEKIFSYPSPPERNHSIRTSFDIIKNDGNQLMVAIHFPVRSNACATEIYSIDMINFQQTYLGTVESAQKPDLIKSAQNDEVFAMYKDPKSRKTMIQKL